MYFLELSPAELVRLGDAVKCSIAEGAEAAAALWPCSPSLELPGLGPAGWTHPVLEAQKLSAFWLS